MSLPEFIKKRIKANIERKVRHLEDSTDTSENWIEFWEEHTGEDIPADGFKCPSCGKRQTDIVGGHVTDDATGEEFITPVCRHCNSHYKNTLALRHHFSVRASHLVPLP